MSQLQLRVATIRDLDAITQIYNDAVRTTTASFDLEEKSAAEQALWFEAHGPQHPVIVAEASGVVIGWASLNKWRDRAGYAQTAETSCYVAHAHRGQGVGRALKQALIEEARRLGFHSLIAQVIQGSEQSLHLNMSLGFEPAGVLREVGCKFGTHLDVHLLQKILD